jgi:hypothetical protein
MATSNPSKQAGWAVMFILWNLGLLVAIIVLLIQLHVERLDTGTVAQACAEAAVSAVKSLK